MTEMIPTAAHPREPSMHVTRASDVHPGDFVLTRLTDQPGLHAVVLVSEETGSTGLFVTEVQKVTRDDFGNVVLGYHEVTRWTVDSDAEVWARKPDQALASVPVQRVLARLPRRLDETIQVRVSTAWATRLDETIGRLRTAGYDVDRSSLIRAAVDDLIEQVP